MDFGGRRERRGWIAHFHRKNTFDLDQMMPVLSDAGFGRVENGTVGFGNLRFVLAAVPGGACCGPPGVKPQDDSQKGH